MLFELTYSLVDMLTRCFSHGLAAVLVLAGLLLVSLAATPGVASPQRASLVLADTTNYPPPPDDDDRECADSVAGCIVGAALYAVFAPAFNALFSDARIAGAGGPAASINLRAGRTFGDSNPTQLLRPYAALGVRFQQTEPPTGAIGAPTVFMETAAGLRSPAHLWMHGSAPWLERIQLSAELQWLYHGDNTDQLWVEVAPALSTSSSDTRLALAPTLSVALAGPQQAVVRPGLSLGVHW